MWRALVVAAVCGVSLADTTTDSTGFWFSKTPAGTLPTVRLRNMKWAVQTSDTLRRNGLAVAVAGVVMVDLLRGVTGGRLGGVDHGQWLHVVHWRQFKWHGTCGCAPVCRCRDADVGLALSSWELIGLSLAAGNPLCLPWPQYAFETSTNTWKTLTTLPNGYAYYASELIWFGGNLVLIGGKAGDAFMNNIWVTRSAPRPSVPSPACAALPPPRRLPVRTWKHVWSMFLAAVQGTCGTGEGVC